MNLEYLEAQGNPLLDPITKENRIFTNVIYVRIPLGKYPKGIKGKKAFLESALCLFIYSTSIKCFTSIIIF